MPRLLPPVPIDLPVKFVACITMLEVPDFGEGPQPLWRIPLAAADVVERLPSFPRVPEAVAKSSQDPCLRAVAVGSVSLGLPADRRQNSAGYPIHCLHVLLPTARHLRTLRKMDAH